MCPAGGTRSERLHTNADPLACAVRGAKSLVPSPHAALRLHAAQASAGWESRHSSAEPCACACTRASIRSPANGMIWSRSSRPAWTPGTSRSRPVRAAQPARREAQPADEGQRRPAHGTLPRGPADRGHDAGRLGAPRPAPHRAAARSPQGRPHRRRDARLCSTASCAAAGRTATVADSTSTTPRASTRATSAAAAPLPTAPQLVRGADPQPPQRRVHPRRALALGRQQPGPAGRATGPAGHRAPSPHRRAPFASSAGVEPGNNITGGKRGSGKTTKGDIWLLDILTQCAWAAARTRDTSRQRDRSSSSSTDWATASPWTGSRRSGSAGFSSHLVSEPGLNQRVRIDE